MAMTRTRLPRHAWIGLLLMALGVVILLIAFLWVATTWLLAVGTLAFWWGVVVLVPEPLKKPAVILMIIGTVWIVYFTFFLAR
jgi:membrane-bound ClpP family serine protease